MDLDIASRAACTESTITHHFHNHYYFLLAIRHLIGDGWRKKLDGLPWLRRHAFMKMLPLRDLTLMTFESVLAVRNAFSTIVQTGHCAAVIIISKFSRHRLFVISIRHYSLVMLYCPSFRMHNVHVSAIVFWIIIQHKNPEISSSLSLHLASLDWDCRFFSLDFICFCLFVLCIALCWCAFYVFCVPPPRPPPRQLLDATETSNERNENEKNCWRKRNKHVSNSKQCNSLSSTYRSERTDTTQMMYGLVRPWLYAAWLHSRPAPIESNSLHFFIGSAWWSLRQIFLKWEIEWNFE